MAQQDGVGVREFARQVGKSATWISKKLKDGTLPRNPDGTIPIEEGFKAFDRLTKETEARATKTASNAVNDDSMIESMSKAKNLTEAMNKARLAKETYQAKLKEIEYRLAKGELVERSVVEQDAQAVASALRQNLMSIPVRISGLCEGRQSREIEEIIEDAINDALAQFQKTEFK